MDASLLLGGAAVGLQNSRSSSEVRSNANASVQASAVASVNVSSTSNESVQERARVQQGARIESTVRNESTASEGRRLPQALRQAVSGLMSKMQEGTATKSDMSDVVGKAVSAGEDPRGLLVDVSA